MKRLHLFAVAAVAAMALALGLAAMPQPGSSINLSGYEFLLGTPCATGGATTCGVEFAGWTGGNGAKPNGWTHLPGSREGLWQATINYDGSPAFGGSVTVTAGTFSLLLTKGGRISGTVEYGGTVTWPAENKNIGCGKNVATVNLNLDTGEGGPTNFQGCLHDLPAGTVIPPKIWGELY